MKDLVKCSVLSIILTIVFTSCTTTEVVNVRDDRGQALMGLDYRDFRQAANELTQSLIQSGRLSKKTGGRYVMATGRVINDTMQRIDTNQLMVEIEDSLTNSGLVAMTAAVGHGGNRDDMIYETRELRKSGEFNQSTVAGEGQLIAPELSIHGKITQRDIKYSGSKTQVEYMFRLYVKDLSSGMVFWQKQVPIIKRGSSKSVSW